MRTDGTGWKVDWVYRTRDEMLRDGKPPRVGTLLLEHRKGRKVASFFVI
jgi:hypothetical protein